MRKFAGRMGTLAAAVGMAALIVVSAQADSSDERKSEKPSPVLTAEFLSISFSCSSFDTTAIQLSFTGSGDLTGGSGNIFLSGQATSASGCEGVAVAMQEVTAGLSCVNSAISGSAPFASFQSVCQAPRTELVNVMGEVSRAFLNLSVTP